MAIRLFTAAVVLAGTIGRAAAAAAAAEPPAAPDHRLDQKITYAAPAATLQALAAELTRRTGVEIRVGAGERDWKVRERKVHANYQDLPLGVVLTETAATVGYQLRRNGQDGRWSYRIWQSSVAQQYEQAMLASETEAAERDVQHVRDTVLQEAHAVDAMSRDDALKLRDTDPWMAYLGGTDSGRAYASLLRNLPTDARELMLRGKKVTLEAADLNPDLQQNLDALLPKKMLDRFKTMGGPMADILGSATPARIVFQPLTADIGAGQATQGMAGAAILLIDPPNLPPDLAAALAAGGTGSIGKGIPIASLPLAGSDSSIGRIVGSALLRLDAGEDPMAVQQDLMARIAGNNPLSEAQARQIVASATPTDARLLAEVGPLHLDIDTKKKETPTAALVRQLGKVTPLSYVMEYYPEETPLGLPLPQRKEPLYQLLDSLQLEGLTWDFSHGVVRIRPKDWAIQRSYDVPEATMAAYRALMTERGWFDLDTLAGIAVTLADGQIQHRLLVDPELLPALMSLTGIIGNRQMLRMYGGLTAPQKLQIARPEGLPIQQLSQEQWQTVAAVVEEEAGGADATSGKITLTRVTAPNPFAARAKSASAAKSGDAGSKAGDTTGKAAGAGSAADGTGATRSGAAPPAASGPGPTIETVTFTIEIPGDSPDKPYRIVRTVQVPGKDEIKAMRGQLDRMYDSGKPPSGPPAKPATPARPSGPAKTPLPASP